MKIAHGLALAAGVLTVTVIAHARVPPIAAAGREGAQTVAAARERASALVVIGRRAFRDPTLSASGRVACATCHVPDRAFGPPPGGALPLAGADGRRGGVRAVPSLRYLQNDPSFTEHYFASDDDADGSVDNGPSGGLTWDGRVDRARDQARLPLFSPFEMANGTTADLAARLRRTSYAADLEALALDPRPNDDELVSTLTETLEAYLETPDEFSPYSSRFDAYLAGEASLTASEERGMEDFENPAKGNCARCHPSEVGPRGTPPLFTDFGYAAIGVPFNPQLATRGDRPGYDRGLCGPFRVDLTDESYCGEFRVPSLRNVALRDAFFHNGAVHSLRDAVKFYVERDVDPEKWYGRRDAAGVGLFDDLPWADRTNLDRDPPFGRHPGDPPALTPLDIEDIVAFLGTLTDDVRVVPAHR